MKSYRITPSKLSGAISASPSKSHTLRAILFASLAHGKSVIKHFLRSPDVDAMINACRLMGAKIVKDGDRLTIYGVAGQPQTPKEIIDAGNSGQVLRFVGAVGALSPGPVVITGDDSIRNNRPVQPLVDGLQQLGVRCDSSSPLSLSGPMQAGVATLDGTDSQPVSGLLIAAAFLNGVTQINVKNPGEKPWVGLTLSWLDRLGVKVVNENFERFFVYGEKTIDAFDYTVPGDFSSVAYPLVAAVLSGSHITIENIDMQDAQGDKKIITALKQMGAAIQVEPGKLIISPSGKLNGAEIDVNDFIDAVTILAVVGCFAQGQTQLTNAYIARKKESDRLATITSELKKMGADIVETSDGLIINQSVLNGAKTISHRDHRIALSLAVAGLAATGQTNIDDIDCVNKSYPSFVEDMQQLGGQIEVQQ